MISSAERRPPQGSSYLPPKTKHHPRPGVYTRNKIIADNDARGGKSGGARSEVLRVGPLVVRGSRTTRSPASGFRHNGPPPSKAFELRSASPDSSSTDSGDWSLRFRAP